MENLVKSFREVIEAVDKYYDREISVNDIYCSPLSPYKCGTGIIDEMEEFCDWIEKRENKGKIKKELEDKKQELENIQKFSDNIQGRDIYDEWVKSMVNDMNMGWILYTGRYELLRFIKDKSFKLQSEIIELEKKTEE
jgi:hypothetical protein